MGRTISSICDVSLELLQSTKIFLVFWQKFLWIGHWLWTILKLKKNFKLHDIFFMEENLSPNLRCEFGAFAVDSIWLSFFKAIPINMSCTVINYIIRKIFHWKVLTILLWKSLIRLSRLQKLKTHIANQFWNSCAWKTRNCFEIRKKVWNLMIRFSWTRI